MEKKIQYSDKKFESLVEMEFSIFLSNRPYSSAQTRKRVEK